MTFIDDTAPLPAAENPYALAVTLFDRVADHPSLSPNDVMLVRTPQQSAALNIIWAELDAASFLFTAKSYIRASRLSNRGTGKQADKLRSQLRRARAHAKHVITQLADQT